VAGVAFLEAHDAYEITSDARIRDGRLELLVTMARSTALAIVSGNKEARPFAPADFEKLHAQFDACAPRLFAIASGGRPLALREARVALGREDDVEFHLVYPAPTQAPLRFTATHMAKLTDHHGAVLTVVAPGAMLGQKLLTLEDPVLEVALAAPRAGGS